MMSLVQRGYYSLRPLIHRTLQIALRRMVARRQRKNSEPVWPIDQEAGKPPTGWRGWPNGKRFVLVLTHDVDTARGHENSIKLMELEERLGFRSSFNFVPERYTVSPEIRHRLTQKGFEVGVHGLLHDGKLYSSRKIFLERAIRINHYLREWKAVGFRSPAMHHNFGWIHEIDIEYDASSFDTDPFEPQSDGGGDVTRLRWGCPRLPVKSDKK